MEFDAGLDRRAAVLAAFALHFPADDRKCREAAAGTLDGETLLYEYLEELIKTGPQKAMEGAAMNAGTKNEESHRQGPESPPQAQETRTTRQGIAALEYFMVRQGIPVIGAYPSGAMLGKQEPENFTTDPAELAALMDGKGNQQGKGKGTAIKRFYFIPKDAGLLCLDIDRKPGKADGLRELYNLFPKDTLPRALQDIDGFFPCYASTPSGGYHLYFKYSGPDIRKSDLCPEVEIKHGRPGLTAPGSEKENGPYILHGDIADAPELYGIILDRIAELQNQRQARAEPQRAAVDRPMTAPRRPVENHGQARKPRITLATLADEAAAAYGGHHDRQVSFAARACRCKFQFADALSYVRGNPAIFGNGADTENTIKTVYQDKGAI
jgi:hypothetical protein